MAKPAQTIELSSEQHSLLKKLVAARNTPQKMVMRAKIILMAADGISNSQIARNLGVSRPTVLRWRQGFQEKGMEGLNDDPRSGRRPALSPQQVKAVVEATLFKKPPHATHWTTRTLAKEFGICHTMIHRIWRSFNLKPHRSSTFKMSKDPKFIEKVKDIVGLYLNPPDKALVLCVDEKSQIQALERTQPLLPMRPGQVERRTWDYARHGTTTLFAALDVANGKVIATCKKRHRSEEFLSFLRLVNKETPSGVNLHLVVDNYCTHKTSKVREWLKKHPRFHLHLTPTSGSWLNMVEIWFGKLTNRRIRRGSFTSVKSLVASIREYIKANNENPVPFRWVKPADEILHKLRL